MHPTTLVLVKILSFAAAAAVCGAVARALAGARGLAGAAVGAGAGAVLCTISHLLVEWSKRAGPRATYTAVYGSTIASLAVLLATGLLVARHARDLLSPALLTLLAVYLAVRFVDVVDASRRMGGPRRSAVGEGPAGAGPVGGAPRPLATGDTGTSSPREETRS